jgi:hypothetical protein
VRITFTDDDKEEEEDADDDDDDDKCYRTIRTHINLVISKSTQVALCH